jgi:putative transcriptional regulator
MMTTMKKVKRTKLGLELEGAFKEMAAHLRGDIELPGYLVHHELFTLKRIKMIRRKVASSTKEFERLFGIPARTMESYEQGRRRAWRRSCALTLRLTRGSARCLRV